MKYLYWGIALTFVSVTSLIGCFLIPYFTWCFDTPAVHIVGLFLSVFLALAVVTCFKRQQLKAAILASIALSLFISSGITFIKFRSDGYRLENYIVSEGTLYSKFGITVVTGKGWNWMILYDQGRNKRLAYVIDDEERTGTEEVPVLDKNGDYKKSYYKTHGTYYVDVDCYKRSYEVYVYDEEGNYVERLEDYYYYADCYASDGDYMYYYWSDRTDVQDDTGTKFQAEVKATVERADYDVLHMDGIFY